MQMQMDQVINKNRNSRNIFPKGLFSIYFGYGPVQYEIIITTIIIGIITLMVSTAIGYILNMCTPIQFRDCFIISIILTSAFVSFFFFRIVGKYKITKIGNSLVGTLRNSILKLRILSFSLVCITSCPALFGLIALESNNAAHQVINVTCLVFVCQVIILAILLLFMNIQDGKFQKVEQPTLQIQDITIKEIKLETFKQQYFKVSNPLMVRLRDSYMIATHLVQTIFIVGGAYLIFCLLYWHYEKSPSLRSTGNWKQGLMSTTSFKFQFVKANCYKAFQYEYYVIKHSNGSLSDKFQNGQNVTFEKITQIFKGDQYFANWSYAFVQNSTKVQKYKDILRLSNGQLLKVNYSAYNNFGFSFIKLNEDGMQQANLTFSDPYTELMDGRTLKKQMYFLNFSLPQLIFLPFQKKLYEFKNQTENIYIWEIPSISSNTTHIISQWILSSTPRSSTKLYYKVQKSNPDNKILQNCYSVPIGSGCSNTLPLINYTNQYISYAGGIVDLQNIWFMRDVNLTQVENLSYKIINRQSQMKFEWDKFYHYYEFQDKNNNYIPNSQFTIWCGIYQTCPTIYMNQFDQMTNISQLYGIKIGQLFYWSLLVTNPTYTETIQSFQYVYHPIQFLKFWYLRLMFILVGVPVFSSIIYFITKHFIYAKCSMGRSTRYHLKTTFYHFILSLAVFLIGALPYYSMLFIIEETPSRQNINTHLLLTIILTALLYFLTLISWNHHSYEPGAWRRSLSISSGFTFKIFIKQTLQQNGIIASDEIVGMIYLKRYKMDFINSYIVRQIILNQTNVQNLKTQLNNISQLKKRSLFTHSRQQQIKQQTIDFSTPIFVIVFISLIYTFIAYYNKVILNINIMKVLAGLLAITGVFCIINFVLQHRKQVFVRSQFGNVNVRKTQRLDLVKIGFLGFLMASIEISLTVCGFFIGIRLSQYYSVWMLISFGFYLFGIFFAYGVHCFWNYCSGVQGIIIPVGLFETREENDYR